MRHAESPYIAGKERVRGLSEKGKIDAVKVKDILLQEDIDVLISSPYERAVLTIHALAEALEKDIILEENIRERQLAGEAFEVSIEQFYKAKRNAYEDRGFSLPGGESSEQAQQRAIQTLLGIMKEFKGKKVVIGTHGDIMTLMINYFDPSYSFEFWESTSMPDIYRLQFEDNSLIDVTRLWNES